MNWLAVFIGGGAGSLTRYGINQLFEKYFSAAFPLATLFANIISCILLGLIFGFGERQLNLSPATKLLLTTGFCGGLSTFSTFTSETFILHSQSQVFSAIINIALNIIVCFGAFFGAFYLAKN